MDNNGKVWDLDLATDFYDRYLMGDSDAAQDAGEIEGEGGAKKGFSIETDGAAEWAIEKIARHQAEIARFKAVADARIEELHQARAKFCAKHENSIEFLTGCLRQYMGGLEIEASKAGNRVYELPSGKLKLTKQAAKIEVDGEAFLKWLKENGKTDYIKETHTESAQWGEFKKITKITDEGAVVTDEGEIVEGVTAEVRDDKFAVEVRI